MDQARLTASYLVDTKTFMSTFLREIKHLQLITALDLDSPDSLYCDVKDLARNGQQHIESLAVIFSGSQNGGKSYCDDCHNPFTVTPAGMRDESGKPIPLVTVKKDWSSFFPTMAILQTYKQIPPYIFTRGFIKKKSKSTTTTPTSSSRISLPSTSDTSGPSSSCASGPSISHTSGPSSSCTSGTYSSYTTGHSSPQTSDPFSSSISSRTTIDPFFMRGQEPISEVCSFDQSYYCADSYSNHSGILEIDITPEKRTSTTRQLFLSGDATELYVIDRIEEHNKGYCSLVVPGSAPLDMEFNIDETCATAKKFDTLPGTHRWMLYKDIVKGDLNINCGVYMSITSILDDKRVTCCQESVGPSDVLFNNPPQRYKIHRDYFRMPKLSLPSPISI